MRSRIAVRNFFDSPILALCGSYRKSATVCRSIKSLLRRSLRVKLVKLWAIGFLGV
ncbi:hypothetical protein [Microcoleus sp. AR_TQ3_B6]|uniref:hypothetical protein n=1 Tax=Microcoleus sp. AR_TQ3_B6 TaxID=3055284 RepID=UPI002FCF865F